MTRGQGYAVEVAAHSIDAVRLDQQVVQGYEQLRLGDPTGALTTFTDAVGLWRGQPVAEVADHAAMQGLVGRLTELHLAAREGRLQALVETGRHVQALPELEAFVTDHPLREQPRALQILALYRAGRAPEALEAHDRFCRLLDDELGLEPSANLADLRQRILLQAPDLHLDLAPEPPSSRLSGPVTEVRQGAGPPLRVVGRESELRRARQHLDRLMSKQGGLVLLRGEAGIGKTTLLEQIGSLATSAALPVHWGRAPSARGAPAFWPWIQVLRSLADGLDAERLARAAAGPAEPVSQLVPELAERLEAEGYDRYVQAAKQAAAVGAE